MPRPQRIEPAPGRPIRRDGLPYIWITWLAKLLGGDQCWWSAWFKARYQYSKYETQGGDLAEWNRDHNRLMRDRRVELEEAGWKVYSESETEFKLTGKTAVIAGKPDILATMPDVKPDQPMHALIVDGKTGKERDSDVWQVLTYLFAIPQARKDLVPEGTDLNGEVHYKRGDKRKDVPMRMFNPKRRADLIAAIETIAGQTAPTKAPSKMECQRCNIGPVDCPERFKDVATTAVSDAF